MKPFLEEIAEYLMGHYGETTGDICLVTPNRRAGLFFRKHLAARITRPVWAPEVLSIEDFINRVSQLEVLDNTSLLFAFYQVYLEVEREAARPIDEFMHWAPVLLRDFDEIDATTKDPEVLFDYLRDVKRIETWNPDGTPLTDFQKNYLAFFSKFKEYHQVFTSQLLSQGKAYQGLSSREAARLVHGQQPDLPWKKIIFAGFNALNRSEETIIDKLIQDGKADFLPDHDPYYSDDPGNEAGLFIRKYLKKWGGNKGDKVSAFTAGKKSIRILGIARNVNQARLAGNILGAEGGPDLNVDTAVVLANEDLLIPVLNALPEGTAGINVTMGYPLQKTNMFGFFDALFQLYLNAGRLRREDGQEPPAFYHRDLSGFFSHSCTAMLWKAQGEEKEPGQGPQKKHPGVDPQEHVQREPAEAAQAGLDPSASLIRALAFSNRSFFHFGDLERLKGLPKTFGEDFRFLESDWNGEPGEIFPSLLELVSRLDARFREKAGTRGGEVVHSPFFLDFESLYYFAAIFRRIQAFLKDLPFLGKLQTLAGLFRQMAGETRLSFSGEPLEGLQVMGVLETRSLDFKNVILLSANESILPRSRAVNSFVPYDVKKKFGLQVHSEKDATYAYHFYRLLQRAETIHLIYNTQTADIGSSEKSRYLTQVQHGLGKINPGIQISEEIVSLPPPAVAAANAIQVEKSAAVMDQLSRAAERGLSPSALGLYISCPLQFFLTRVCRIEEPADLEETIDAATMGTVIHGVLETLYRTFSGKALQPGHIDPMVSDAGRVTGEQFAEHYPQGDIRSGKNLLLFHLAKQYVTSYLKKEKIFLEQCVDQGVSLKLIGLEQLMEADIAIRVGDREWPVRIRGKADRVDILDGTIRIIDYKTGKVDNSELKFESWEQVTQDHARGKAFQLLTYAWMYKKMNPGTAGVMPGIVSMRDIGKGLLTLTFPGGFEVLDAEHLSLFEAQLGNLLTELMDPAIPFSQTTEEKNCRYCPYRVLCRRF
jgi:ATP-dependent helicase/nuclease subunit B